MIPAVAVEHSDSSIYPVLSEHFLDAWIKRSLSFKDFPLPTDDIVIVTLGYHLALHIYNSKSIEFKGPPNHEMIDMECHYRTIILNRIKAMNFDYAITGEEP